MKKIVAALTLLVVLISAAACHIEITTTGPGQIGTPAGTPSTTPASTSVTIVPIDPAWKAPAVNTTAAALPDIAEVVARCNPSVVTITTEQIVNDMFSRQVVQSGAGSGWILDNKKGIVVTNNHVVEGAKKVVIQFANGKTFEGNSSNVFRDPTTDLAIIKVNPENLSQLAIGDSEKLRVGEWVVVIGNPLGKGIKAKEGIISGLKISLSSEEEDALYDLIETSAAINAGNSGGPLLNMKGEVIGITSAKIASVGVEGMGYAISIDTALPILQELINKGFVTRPFLGVELYTVNDYVAYYNGLGVTHGAVVTVIQSGSPAAIAGLKRLDVITKYKNQEINNAPELLKALRNSQIGEEVAITYVRGKTVHNTSAVLVTSPPPK